MTAIDTIKISPATESILGLTDMGRYTDIERVSRGRAVYCTGPAGALQDLVNEIHDRATEGEGGYDHSSAEKSCLRNNLKTLKSDGWVAK